MTPTGTPPLQLRDIHLPQAPDFWPPAPGWWLAAAVVLALLAWLGLTGWRRLRLQRRRRRLLQSLEQLDRTLGPEQDPRFASEVSILLRRLALTRYPRQQVAGLTGEAWLRFLDRHGGDGGFTTGPGRVLADAPYAPQPRIDREALRRLAEKWILNNTGTEARPDAESRRHGQSGETAGTSRRPSRGAAEGAS